MKTRTKLTAVKLRKSGMTYGEISIKLKVSKSTLSGWLSGTKLNRRAISRLKSRQDKFLVIARDRAIAMNNENRANIRRAVDRTIQGWIENINWTPLLMKLALAFLYLGEGAKWKSHRGLQLGSSDPNIILLYISLLKICYGIDKTKLGCYICYRADQDIGSLKQYWSQITGIKINRFYDSKPDHRTIGKITKNVDYKGVCVVSSGGTLVQQELEAIPISILKGPLAQLVERSHGMREVTGSSPVRSTK